ncbi:MAG: response regulator transcription factor [Methylacidiphilales bacterium]|nr:response regulator transcription factor [Candidatus Methylacidiphilales bacterium]
MVKSTKILSVHIADDHPLIRSGIQELLASHFGKKVLVTGSGTLDEASAYLKKHQVDILLLDLHLPDSDSFTGLIKIKSQFKTMPVVILTADNTPEICEQAKRYGASGFVSKHLNTVELIYCLEHVQKGLVWFPATTKQSASPEAGILEKIATLSPQQHEVLRLVAKGLQNKIIAHQLSITEATVKSHISSILLKLKVRNRTQAVLLYNHR